MKSARTYIWVMSETVRVMAQGDTDQQAYNSLTPSMQLAVSQAQFVVHIPTACINEYLCYDELKGLLHQGYMQKAIEAGLKASR